MGSTQGRVGCAVSTALLSSPEIPAHPGAWMFSQMFPIPWMNSHDPVWSSTTHTSLGRKEGNQEALVRDKTEIPFWPHPRWTMLREPCSFCYGRRGESKCSKVLVQGSKGALGDSGIVLLILFRDKGGNIRRVNKTGWVCYKSKSLKKHCLEPN